MTQHLITTTTGESFQLPMPEPSEFDSFFAFAMPKSGSTLMDKMLRDVCKAVGMAVVAPYEVAFRTGIQPVRIDQSLEACFKSTGYAYLGFRAFLGFEPTFDFATVKKLLLVRDPRDMLVSLYFSIKYSHSIPKSQGSASRGLQSQREYAAEVDIDEFVIERAPYYRGLFAQFRSKLPETLLKTYRYEDVIFDKPRWLADMVEFLELPLEADQVSAIAARHDILPDQEKPSDHIRQVTPGNYRKHLTEQTIAQLGDMLGKTLDANGYQR